MNKVKVWDLPTRVCHWLFVILFVFQYLSVEVFDDDILENTMQWHFYMGYSMLGLVIFRICWGLMGTHYARFSQFIVSPRFVLSYMSTKTSNKHNVNLGHNPAGAYSIMVLLGLILLQASSGLFVSDEIFSEGPYYGLLTETWQDAADYLHHNAYYVLLAFVGIHIAAVLFYKSKLNQPLTSAMISGYKSVEHDTLDNSVSENTNPERIQHQYTDIGQTKFPWLRFLLSLLITAMLIYLIVEVWPPEVSSDIYDF